MAAKPKGAKIRTFYDKTKTAKSLDKQMDQETIRSRARRHAGQTPYQRTKALWDQLTPKQRERFAGSVTATKMKKK